jgi:NYN domain
MDAHVLVDYYNLPKRLLNAGLVAFVSQMESVVRSASPDVVDVFVRLYGGWYDESGLSNDGTLLAQDISQNFPKSIRNKAGVVCHTYCDMASSLIKLKSDLFFATVREKRGITRLLRTASPPACIDSLNCTAPSVVQWSRRGCPTAGCPVSNFDAFVCKQQKLVDILICCDLLTLATTGAKATIFLFSEDDDFIPALLLAGSHTKDVWHVRTQPKKPRLYDALLMRNGVKMASI